MAKNKFVIKGFNCTFDRGPKDAYIMLRPDIGYNTHERIEELNDRVTRFDTYEEAEKVADAQIKTIFERYEIQKAEAVKTTQGEE